MLTPATWSIGIPASRVDFIIPIWDKPRAPPPPKTIPTDSPVMYLNNRKKMWKLVKIRNSFIFFVKRLKTCVEQVQIWDKSRALPPPKTIPTDSPVILKHFEKKNVKIKIWN